MDNSCFAKHFKGFYQLKKVFSDLNLFKFAIIFENLKQIIITVFLKNEQVVVFKFWIIIFNDIRTIEFRNALQILKLFMNMFFYFKIIEISRIYYFHSYFFYIIFMAGSIFLNQFSSINSWKLPFTQLLRIINCEISFILCWILFKI